MIVEDNPPNIQQLRYLDNMYRRPLLATMYNLLYVQEAPKHVGFMAEIAARIAEGPALYSLLAPVKRLCGMDIPIPYAPQLEKAAVPQLEDIVAGAVQLMREP